MLGLLSVALMCLNEIIKKSSARLHEMEGSMGQIMAQSNQMMQYMHALSGQIQGIMNAMHSLCLQADVPPVAYEPAPNPRHQHTSKYAVKNKVFFLPTIDVSSLRRV